MTVSPPYYSLVASTLAFVCLAVVACGDDKSDDTPIAVDDLTSSECIKDSAASAGPNEARCVVSQRKGQTLSLQVFGLDTLCLGDELLADVPWHAVAKAEPSGRVVVSVDWPSDKTPACGPCRYNFMLDLGPYDWSDRTDIQFEVRSCPSCDVDDSRSVTLGTKDDETAVHACGDELLDAGGN